MAVNALHLHTPAWKAQSHQYPYFLFSKSQNQLHIILPGRISKDITNIDNLRLWAPPGKRVISTFSRTKHLNNLTCPGQAPGTYRRFEKRTWTSRQPTCSQLSLYLGWCKQGLHVMISTSHQTADLSKGCSSHQWSHETITPEQPVSIPDHAEQ